MMRKLSAEIGSLREDMKRPPFRYTEHHRHKRFPALPRSRQKLMFRALLAALAPPQIADLIRPNLDLETPINTA
jgi:hypothetical protein